MYIITKLQDLYRVIFIKLKYRQNSCQILLLNYIECIFVIVCVM